MSLSQNSNDKETNFKVYVINENIDEGTLNSWYFLAKDRFFAQKILQNYEVLLALISSGWLFDENENYTSEMVLKAIFGSVMDGDSNRFYQLLEIDMTQNYGKSLILCSFNFGLE